MVEQRPAADLVLRFGQRRGHAYVLPGGGSDDDELRFMASGVIEGFRKAVERASL